MDIIKELNRIKIDKHKCLGCGYENSCATKGCAIINQAINVIETTLNKVKRLKNTVKECDDNCTFCVNAKAIPKMCNYDCSICGLECKCKSCTNNSMYDFGD